MRLRNDLEHLVAIRTTVQYVPGTSYVPSTYWQHNGCVPDEYWVCTKYLLAKSHLDTLPGKYITVSRM